MLYKEELTRTEATLQAAKSQILRELRKVAREDEELSKKLRQYEKAQKDLAKSGQDVDTLESAGFGARSPL